jgi:hypothetical protein
VVLDKLGHELVGQLWVGGLLGLKGEGGRGRIEIDTRTIYMGG